LFSFQEKEISDQDKKRLTLDETRKSLPIFPFREDLLNAVKDHQVSIRDIIPVVKPY